MPPVVEVQHLNHWTTREVPLVTVLEVLKHSCGVVRAPTLE